jgi:hypothetical protein
MPDPESLLWISLCASLLSILVNGGKVFAFLVSCYGRLSRKDGYQMKAVVISPRIALLTICLILVAVASSIIGLLVSPQGDFPEWPQPRNSYVKTYASGPEDCLVVADGDRFLKYAGKYRIAAGCFAYTGIGDILDVPQLQVSAASDIRPGEIPLRTVWAPSFREHIERLHAGGLNHVLMLLPTGIKPGQFATFREAKQLGVRLITVGATISSVQ